MQDNVAEDEKAPKFKVPDDFEDEEEFLEHVRKLYSDDVGADQINRDEALQDAKFVAGVQWAPEVYNERIRNGKPALTINRLPAYVAQLVGNRRLNETTIRILPDHDGDKDCAAVREGLIRNIQKTSRAKRAYDAAYQTQIIGGDGAFQVCLDYTSDDAFEQDICIEPIYDPLAVVWDRASVDPTGADARHVFVTDYMSRKEFETMYPKATITDFQSDLSEYSRLSINGWVTMDRVRVADFWRMRSRKRLIAQMQDGKTHDVTDVPEDEWMPFVNVRQNGQPVVREARVKYAEMYRVCGTNILEGPYELPIKRVPVFRCVGWEINTGEYKTRFGLVRWLRDPIRIGNYMESVKIEKIMLTPKAKWLVGKTSGQGYEDAFRNAHVSDDSVLFWNDEGGAAKPEYTQPAQIEAALIQASQEATQMIKDISNMHEASLGQTSNEVSGRAIMARQRVGETGSVIYQDNLNMAIEEAGRVINDLIPFVYDTPRVLKVIGQDDETNPQYVKVNYDDDPRSIDLTTGKYNVTVVTGPSYATKRIEAAESMMAAVNAMPETFAVAGDLIAEAQDWPDADKIARRIRARMPPDILGDDITPEQREQLQVQAQKEQIIEKLALAEKVAELKLKAAQANELDARAEMERSKAGTDEVRAMADVAKKDADARSQSFRDLLQAIDAMTGENNVSG